MMPVSQIIIKLETFDREKYKSAHYASISCQLIETKK